MYNKKEKVDPTESLFVGSGLLKRSQKLLSCRPIHLQITRKFPGRWTVRETPPNVDPVRQPLIVNSTPVRPKMRCPNCRNMTEYKTTTRTSSSTHVLACILCFFFFPLSFLIYCCPIREKAYIWTKS